MNGLLHVSMPCSIIRIKCKTVHRFGCFCNRHHHMYNMSEFRLGIYIYYICPIMELNMILWGCIACHYRYDFWIISIFVRMQPSVRLTAAPHKQQQHRQKHRTRKKSVILYHYTVQYKGDEEKKTRLKCRKQTFMMT